MCGVMADGKLYRLITVGLWVGFVAELFLVFNLGWTFLLDWGWYESVLNDLYSGLFMPASLCFYPFMLGVQYVVEGSFKWFPWNR